ncbi:hypothetical protein PHMEG_0002642 [Phytophthora megakarya]|uniref:D-lactate dehydrogenase (cytochrome) n=1 Tax=Phytophthora megakarya TaxID=4795 RepID=A0A225X031_9STRA|nr:hypothetical protein PHMEG_0002642 [Phytophthora megakarya]
MYAVNSNDCRLQQHGTDESYLEDTPPDAVAFVQSTDEVAEAIKICAATRTPIIPFGAGTSIEGHISAVVGGVSVDLSGMNGILKLDRENMSVKVEAGVTREQLNADLRATGLMFPVDPGANATIGGMVATNASGTTTVKYGNMKTNVLALTAVMADGRIIKTGSKARKSSAGYDLTRLLIGAEGTLAVVTEIELRLSGVPEAEKAMICSFDKMKDAIDTCTTVMQMGIPVARMEMMDENVVDAVNKYSKLDNPLRPSLIIEHHGSANELEQQSSAVQEIAREFGAMDIEVATTAEDRKRLWSGRHSVWHAVLSQVPGSRGFSADVAVPFSKLTGAVVETQQDLKDSELFGIIVGHVGDGNFHVLIPFTNDNKEHLVDPGANATIGGMISTNASGTTTVRYGNMKTNVMALTAVMADGRIIKTGSKTRKSSAGYDLTRLLIGSEGTLAVVTEAELRLFGNPEAEKTMICSFNSMKDAVDTCAAVMQMGIPVARMELMDENAVEAINKYSKLENPIRPSLIIEHHGSPGEVEEQSAIVVEIANDFEAKDIELATSAEERKKLWSGRHSAWWATLSQMPGSRGLVTDVAVPPSKLADVIVETQADLKETGLFGGIVGHVGDGNFHVMIPFDQSKPELMTKVKSFSSRLVERALAYEGTCTGEHGVGLGKMNYVSIEHRDSVDVMRTIKKALDPQDIMNPGKMLHGKAQG